MYKLLKQSERQSLPVALLSHIEGSWESLCQAFLLIVFALWFPTLLFC